MRKTVVITAVFTLILALCLLAGRGSDGVSNALGTMEVDYGDGSYIPVPGKSAYEIAVDHGFVGTEADWLDLYQGTKISISKEGYWIIDGELTEYRADAGEQIQELSERLDSLFETTLAFEKHAVTTNGPSWQYTTSTFSGWGGSIGKPAEVDTIRFRVRAREKAITQIKVFLCQYDKNGPVLFEETLFVDIQPGKDAYVCWRLDEVYQNSDGIPLYFAYNCDQLCDMWSNNSSSYIPSGEYQAVQAYTTNGQQLSSPAKMVNVAGNPCRYLYAELGHAQEVYVLDFLEAEPAVAEKVNVFLPERYELVAGDNFQLFYRGVVQAVDPYSYHIRVTCSKGAAYPRYFEWCPTAADVGSYQLTLEVYDNNHNLLGEDSTTLIVKEAAAPSREMNVLCVGDSLTAGGVWPGELYRRLAQEGGTPAGNGFDNIRFVGGDAKTVGGDSFGFEGNPGWTWATYTSDKSPFYNPETGEISFRYYCQQNSIESLDAVYFLLTWNGQGTPSQTDFSLSAGHFLQAQSLIDILHAEYPEAIVRCMGIQMPSQTGGMGTSYGANGGYSDAYGILVTAMHYNAALEDMCSQEKYADFVKYVDVAGQFDTDYNMPSKEKPVNNRSAATEVIGTNGVHPANAGYYQIADAAYRSLCHDILTWFQ